MQKWYKQYVKDAIIGLQDSRHLELANNAAYFDLCIIDS
jgi:hypothetical protein